MTNAFEVACDYVGCAAAGAGLVWLLVACSHVLRIGYRGRPAQSWSILRRLSVTLLCAPAAAAAVMTNIMVLNLIKASPGEYVCFVSAFSLCLALCWRFKFLSQKPIRAP